MGERRYSLRTLQKARRNPRLFFGEVRYLGMVANQAVHRSLVPNTGTKLLDEDWDNLLILDAARVDCFLSVLEDASSPADDEYEFATKTSLGSSTPEFLQKNFHGEKAHDTVYVSANPQTTKLPSDTFHAHKFVFDDFWDEEYRTVLPDDVADQARGYAEEYPDKRLIVHFIQPHMPLITERGREMSRVGVAGRRDHSSAYVGEDDLSIFPQLRAGLCEYSIEEIKAEYRESLRIAFGEAVGLAEELPGKTVITADHGELFGERLWPIPMRGYGHDVNLRVSDLVDVPWLELPSEYRKSITSAPPQELDKFGDVQERLADLGYVSD